MHGPTCIFWANLTPFSLQHHGRVKQLGALRAEADKVEQKIKRALESSEMTPISPEQLAKYLPKGELGLQLCKGRIKTALSGVTKYSQASACQTLCRVVSFKHSRVELTKHENELIYLQERLEKLAEGAPTALTWLDFSQGFEAMLQASDPSEPWANRLSVSVSGFRVVPVSSIQRQWWLQEVEFQGRRLMAMIGTR